MFVWKNLDLAKKFTLSIFTKKLVKFYQVFFFGKVQKSGLSLKKYLVKFYQFFGKN
jgi:hypothetical protein